MNTIDEVLLAIPTVKPFLSAAQLEVMGDACRGEEGQFFKGKFCDLANTIRTMPKTYEQDGAGEEAVAYLHYFKSDMDYYITERDSEKEQHQAFGLACMWEEEMGYISIVELVAAGFDLDLHFEPTTLKEIKRKRAA